MAWLWLGAALARLVNSVGRRRARQDPAAVEALLPEHAGTDLRRGLERQRPRGCRTG